MNHRIFVLASLVLSIFFVSCQNNAEYQSGEFKTLSPLKITTHVSQLDEYISDIKFLRIESNDKSNILKIRKILFIDKETMAIQSHSGISLIDLNGKYIRDFGRKGKGPGEYISVRDFFITSDKKSIGILDPYETINLYKISDGLFLKSIKPTWSTTGPTADDICPSRKNGFFLFRPQSANDKTFSQDFYCLTEFDDNGKIRKEFILRDDFIFNIPFFSQGIDDNYFIRITEGSNILRYINDGTLTTSFEFDYEDKAIPPRHIYSFSKDPWKSIAEYSTAPYYKFFNNFRETDHQLYYNCYNDSLEFESFLIQKESQIGIRWHSDNSCIVLNSLNGHFILSLEDNVEQNDPLKKYILNNLPIDMDPENYPILCFVKFKLL